MPTSNELPDPERPKGPESSSEDEAPPTQPSGALVPPTRKPPTAIESAAEPPFPPSLRRFREAWRQPGWREGSRFARLATEFFDVVDGFADRIAQELGLRR